MFSFIGVLFVLNLIIETVFASKKKPLPFDSKQNQILLFKDIYKKITKKWCFYMVFWMEFEFDVFTPLCVIYIVFLDFDDFVYMILMPLLINFSWKYDPMAKII